MAGREKEVGAAKPAVVGDGFGEGAEQSLFERGSSSGNVSGVAEQANEAMDVGAEELADADGVVQGFDSKEGRWIGGVPEQVEDEGDAGDVRGKLLVVAPQMIGEPVLKTLVVKVICRHRWERRVRPRGLGVRASRDRGRRLW